jgi:hypothetical protein
LTALAERVDVALHRLQRRQRRALDRHQMEADRQEMLADDVQARARQEMMDVGDAAGDRVVDRDHAIARRAVRDRGERILEGAAGQELAIRKDLEGGLRGEGSGLTLIGNDD